MNSSHKLKTDVKVDGHLSSLDSSKSMQDREHDIILYEKKCIFNLIQVQDLKS